MKQTALWLVVWCGGLSQTVYAGDFVLRLEETVYDSVADGKNKKKDENKPVGQVQSSLKLLIRPGERFSGMAQIGARKLSIRGLCKRGERPDQLTLHLAGGVYKATGNVVPAGAPQEQTGSNFQTTVTVKLNEPVVLAGSQISGEKNRDLTGRKVQSEMKLVLTVSEEGPGDERQP